MIFVYGFQGHLVQLARSAPLLPIRYSHSQWLSRREWARLWLARLSAARNASTGYMRMLKESTARWIPRYSHCDCSLKKRKEKLISKSLCLNLRSRELPSQNLLHQPKICPVAIRSFVHQSLKTLNLFLHLFDVSTHDETPIHRSSCSNQLNSLLDIPLQFINCFGYLHFPFTSQNLVYTQYIIIQSPLPILPSLHIPQVSESLTHHFLRSEHSLSRYHQL